MITILRRTRSISRQFFSQKSKEESIWIAGQTNAKPDAPTALLFGFSRWKTFILDYLSSFNVVVMHFGRAAPFDKLNTIESYTSPHVFTWSYKTSPDLALFCKQRGIPLTYVEDGFIRSHGLGAKRTSPASLVFDRQAMHFDRFHESELDQILNSFDFNASDHLMPCAEKLAALINHQGLTKYKLHSGCRVADVLTPGRERVLVIGQVEDDLSIRFGAERSISGNELVMIAADENPQADILYRPHPEALAFSKPHYSDPRFVSNICTVLGPDYAIDDCIAHADLVYTVTSLAGFEAALRSKPVITFGSPFYAGWGITQDRLAPVKKRSRKLSAVEILAGAYLKYPRYLSVADDADCPEKHIVKLAEEMALRPT